MKLLKETLGWAYLAVVMTMFIFTIALYVEPAQAQYYNAELTNKILDQVYGKDIMPGARPDRQPNTRPYKRQPNIRPYNQGTTHYQVSPNYSYGTMNGQDYSIIKSGNVTYINAGDKSVTCQTVGNYSWCE